MRSRASILTLGLTALLAAAAAAQPTRKAPDPTAGYTFDQVRAFHAQFDLATWQTTTDNDYARYTLQRAAEFFPHMVLSRAGPVRRLETAPDPRVGRIEAETPPFGKLSLEEYLARSETDGFLVIHQGKIVYERYPRMRPDTRHLFWSVSKTFASLLVAQLEAEGRVKVDAPIETYLPELRGTAWQGTPVIDILDQASGMDALENDEPNTWERPELAVFQYESSIGLLKRTPAAERSTYEIVAAVKRLRPSGERFEYLSINTFALSWLAERVTGRPYADLIGERIWGRMGAEADGQIVVAPRTGAPASHGGISATLRDLGRYGVLYTPSWRVVSQSPVVPAGYVARIQQGGRPELVARAAPGSKALVIDGDEVARHETWQWDAVWPDGDFFKAGFRGQGLYVSPARDLVIAFVSAENQSQKRYPRALARSGLFGSP